MKKYVKIDHLHEHDSIPIIACVLLRPTYFWLPTLNRKVFLHQHESKRQEKKTTLICLIIQQNQHLTPWPSSYTQCTVKKWAEQDPWNIELRTNYISEVLRDAILCVPRGSNKFWEPKTTEFLFTNYARDNFKKFTDYNNTWRWTMMQAIDLAYLLWQSYYCVFSFGNNICSSH